MDVIAPKELCSHLSHSLGKGPLGSCALPAIIQPFVCPWIVCLENNHLKFLWISRDKQELQFLRYLGLCRKLVAGRTLVMKEGAKAISSYVVVASDCFIAFYWKLYRGTSLSCPLRAYQDFSRPSVRCAEGSMSPKFASITVPSGLQRNNKYFCLFSK